MRVHTIAVALACAGIAASSATAAVDPGRLVLRSTDVPAGFVADTKSTGVRTNQDEAGTDRKSGKLIVRLGRVTGYQAEWRRASEVVVSRADVFRTRAGARTYIGLAATSFRNSGIKGLRRSTIRLGEEGYVFHGGASDGVVWVVWRSGTVAGMVVGWGLSRATGVGLARKQQRRIASARG